MPVDLQPEKVTANEQDGIGRADKKRANATRTALIEAAERLLAEGGVRTLSLRQVNKEAGQKNSGAIHYHFGSKEAILSAILEKRMAVLDAERQEALKAVDAEALSNVDLLIMLGRPLSSRVETDEGWRHYALFAKDLSEYQNREYRPLYEGRFSAGAERIFEILRRRAGDVDERRWHENIHTSVHIGFTFVAERVQKMMPDAQKCALENLEDFLRRKARVQELILFGD